MVGQVRYALNFVEHETREMATALEMLPAIGAHTRSFLSSSSWLSMLEALNIWPGAWPPPAPARGEGEPGEHPTFEGVEAALSRRGWDVGATRLPFRCNLRSISEAVAQHGFTCIPHLPHVAVVLHSLGALGSEGATSREAVVMDPSGSLAAVVYEGALEEHAGAVHSGCVLWLRRASVTAASGVENRCITLHIAAASLVRVFSATGGVYGTRACAAAQPSPLRDLLREEISRPPPPRV
jgi:hypothetical protein